MNNLNNQIVWKDQEISQTMVALETSENKKQDAKRRMEGAFKELNHN